MRLNAWRLRTEALELPDGLGEPDPPPPPPGPGGIALPKFWTEPVAYHAALDWSFIHGAFDVPGPAACWTRLRQPLVRGEEASPLERLLVMADAASGISHVLDWRELGVHQRRARHPPRAAAGGLLDGHGRDHAARSVGCRSVHQRAVRRAGSRRRIDQTLRVAKQR